MMKRLWIVIVVAVITYLKGGYNVSPVLFWGTITILAVIWLRAVLEPPKGSKSPQVPEFEFPTAIPVVGAVLVIYEDSEIRLTPDEARERGFVEAAEKAEELARESGEET